MMKSEKVFIRKANLEDLDLVMQIIKSCTQDMISKKIYQWNDKYPNKETFHNDIKNEHSVSYTHLRAHET